MEHDCICSGITGDNLSETGTEHGEACGRSNPRLCVMLSEANCVGGVT